EDGRRDDLVTGVQTCALPISGECASVPGLSRVTPLPSAAFIFKISELPKRVLMNTIEAPSRDHDASVSSAGSVVRRTRFVPSTLIAQISLGDVGESVQLNAIRLLSGAHAGAHAAPVAVTIRTTPDPSGFIR